MCEFRIDRARIVQRLGFCAPSLDALSSTKPIAPFTAVTSLDDAGLKVSANAAPLIRLIARALDAYDMGKGQHCAAI
ncbi:MAG: hypothetical protein U5N55_05700 [Cypionkella sp.]|nr:hypothetical protein [Cypionkella sp.]